MLRIIENRLTFLAVITAPICTLMITPWMNWDPINLGKIVVLSSLAFSMFSITLSSKNYLRERVTVRNSLMFISFVFALFLPLFTTDAPIAQQMWGIMGRNTGFLTYFSLALLAFVASTLRVANLSKRLVKALIITGIISAIYGIFQILKLDPIGWSQFAVFGTLGNVNFMAAFLAIVSVAVFSLVISNEFSVSKFTRVLLICFLLVLVFINLKTDSMQGPVTLVIGFYASLLITLWKKSKLSDFRFAALSIAVSIVISAPAVVGLFGRGPLGKFLYQDSNVFRKDYMSAGWRMTLQKPLTGIGLDSYDNWYRTYRGFVAAFRTGPNRTSNSAHNIWLDLSSGGGFPLLLSYLAIVLSALIISVKALKTSSRIEPYFLALFSSFLAYHFQSLLSINQIGVGVWGWVLTGALIGASRFSLERQSDNQVSSEEKGKRNSGNRKNLKKSTLNVNSSLPATTAMIGLAGFVLGFSLSYIPLSADAEFRRATNSHNLGNIVKSVSRTGSNAFMMAKGVQAAVESQNSEVAMELTRNLTSKYPREIYGWDVMARSMGFSESERNLAKTKLTSIDPNFFCYDPNPSSSFLRKFDELTTSEKGELLSWWGLAPRRGADLSDIQAARTSEAFLNRAASICG